MFHKDAILGDAHYAHAWEYADAAARSAATGFVAGDVKKLALQLDNNTLWVLTATTPTWVSAGAAGGTHAILSDLGTSGHPASIIANTPAGNIAATNVQAAINELDTEKSATGHTHTAPSVTVTARTIGASTNLDTALGNLDDSIASQKDSGVLSWGGSGNYYSIATNQLTLLRSGTGYINGQKITWAASQVTGTFTTNSAHWIYIDSAGLIGMTTTMSDSIYLSNIPLFTVHYDGTSYLVGIEDHSVAFGTHTARYLHKTLGTVLVPAGASSAIGADMARVTTGTGSVPSDRQIKLLGASILTDQGLETSVPDSAGAAISWIFVYEDPSGYWKEDSSGTAFPMKYNNAGVMTALATSGTVSDVGIWTCYVCKADPNTSTARYIAVAHNAAFGSPTPAQNAIDAGTNRQISGTLGLAMEFAQLGTIVLQNNATSGYINTVNISKSTARSSLSGGGAATAAQILASTTNFLGTLSATDTDVQKALETLDTPDRLSASIAASATTDLSSLVGRFNHVTGSTTITSFGTRIAGSLHTLVFEGAPLVTHNALSLILPGASNIQTAAGDVMLLRSEGNGTGAGSSGTYWRCVGYLPNAVSAATTIAAHLADTVDAHVATAIGNTPAGNIVATTVQAAINELDSEKAPANPLATDTLWDAAGDLVVGSGANTAAKLSKGTALQVLRVNAGGTAIEWATPAGGGDALTTQPLSQFAATTSLQLAGVISDETGSGALVFGTSPVLTTPQINDTSADHQYIVAVSELTADRTVTLPLLTGNDEFVFNAHTQTLTNKRTTARVTTETSSATPTINTDNTDIHTITALAVDITSMTTNLTGTPVTGDSLIIQITGTAARAITWGVSFESSTVTLPSTTVTTAMLTVGFLWNAATSKWRCVASV